MYHHIIDVMCHALRYAPIASVLGLAQRHLMGLDRPSESHISPPFPAQRYKKTKKCQQHPRPPPFCVRLSLCMNRARLCGVFFVPTTKNKTFHQGGEEKGTGGPMCACNQELTRGGHFELRCSQKIFCFPRLRLEGSPPSVA